MLESEESALQAIKSAQPMHKIHFTFLVYHNVVNNAGTLTGGCHCGAVRFEVIVERWQALRCDCSICTKNGYLHLISNRENFTLLQGADVLQEYRFNSKVARHLFCRICGVQSFYVPRSHPDGYSVNVRCLDGDVIERFELIPFDGKHWEKGYSGLDG